MLLTLELISSKNIEGKKEFIVLMFKSEKDDITGINSPFYYFDDVIETIMLNMLYAGQYGSMLPKLKSDHYENMELIRPLYLVRENDIKKW